MLFRNEYAFLSNMYSSNIKYDNIVYSSVENAYQAAKTDDISQRKTFENIAPVAAKKLGRL